MGIGLFMGREPLWRSSLGRWIAENRPELDKEISGLQRSQVLDVLNRETGLQVPGTASIESTLPLFLEALKKKKGD